jgi:4-amino-4-deoxy-L-arabinose transferase-like glycosyltransferase
VGLALLVDSLWRSSATYDEVAYLRIAARWWRTGDQQAITRMGSPLTFWKLQQVPVLWALDRAGLGFLVDHPIQWQATLLPLVRLGSLWIWLLALALTAAWSRLLYGPRAMAAAAWLFALSPNLLAHGALVTMELPLVAGTVATFLLFWRFLQANDRRAFWAAAVVAGVTFSCKFTTIVLPPILALAWLVDRWQAGQPLALRRVVWSMLGFLVVMGTVDILVTGFALMPLSGRTGSHPMVAGSVSGPVGKILAQAIEWPIPQDWVGLATQIRHQRSGGPSYLLGERRMRGWWYYYLVALAVKVPLSALLLVAARAALRRQVRSAGRDTILPLAIATFLAVTAAGSMRNYGVRYLLPLAPLAIVWVSALAEAGPWARRLAVLGLLGQAAAVASIHPYELSYFNVLAGGPGGGKRILADSNLDWGQGARLLARWQQERPELRSLTLYYFGDTDPAAYGVVGRRIVIDASDRHPDLPVELACDTPYLAVSTSLQFGPWGPAGYFRRLDGVEPIAVLPDHTIAVYRAADLDNPR